MYNHARTRLTGLSLALAAISSLAVPIASAEVIATVNGADIEQSTFDFYLQNRIQKPIAQATEEERAFVLQELKDIYILTTQPRAKVLAADPVLKAQIELQQRAAIAQAVAGDWLENNPATEEEIRTAYEAQALLTSDMQYKARHILVETQSKAVDLIGQLAAGASFEELARENSTGPSGPSGGDLGWFSPDQMVAAFSDAVVALEDGAYTKLPVQTEFGWHVILREESRKNEPPPLDSVRDSVKSGVEQANFQRYIEDLRTEERE